MDQDQELLIRLDDSFPTLTKICSGINKLLILQHQTQIASRCNQGLESSQEVSDRENHHLRINLIITVSPILNTKDNSAISLIKIYRDIRVLAQTWVV